MRRLLPLVVLLPLCGCSESASLKSLAPEVGAIKADVGRAAGGMGPQGAVKQLPADAIKPADKDAVRKIIYTGTIDVVVTDFDGATEKMLKLVEECGGYVSNSRLDASDGDRRRATWTLRVPVAKFRSVIDNAGQLGHVINTHTDSQDVTDEFFDLEARLKTKQEEEKSLRELLGKTTDKLENLLAIRRELMRVREEIESAQGRLNKLSKLSELTTITITLQERKDYVPPTAPTFGSRARHMFGDSANAVWAFLKNLVLVAIGLVPWLPLILIGVGIPFFLLRWLIRWSNRATASRVVELPPAEADAAPENGAASAATSGSTDRSPD